MSKISDRQGQFYSILKIIHLTYTTFHGNDTDF